MKPEHSGFQNLDEPVTLQDSESGKQVNITGFIQNLGKPEHYRVHTESGKPEHYRVHTESGKPEHYRVHTESV